MSPVTETAWNTFRVACNFGAPHPLDLKRFDHFIVRAHRTADRIDIEELLAQTSASEEVAEQLALRYETGRAVLLVSDDFP